MNCADLHGFVPAIVTPFTASGDIMEDAFLEIFEHLLSRGASAVCIAGDNGESWSLSAAERGRLVRIAADRAAGRAKIILGVSAPTLAASLNYVRAARENGADALLSMPQTYVLKATDEEILRRFEAIGAEGGLPIVLYNSPRRAGFSMSIDVIERLSEGCNVIGIKESHRDFFHHSHLLDRLADRISVMTGPCHFILPSVPLGARGFIATGPEFTTEAPSTYAALAASPNETYRRTHQQLTGVYEALMGIATWPASFKAALNLIGLPAGLPRDPVMAATGADVDRLRATFDRLGIARAR
ncbi:dihydrodipicolinate synthase family protein [Acuticoccus sediminis]|uniref:dihydrodipicolinate synthase family protein n=1 Tax=Acuticoccus sediminis TaxID=2184697 RepID=UPI001CFCCAAE|nr:dihydrodipicolinate synthase family protein [Acuticoccus sediminis]